MQMEPTIIPSPALYVFCIFFAAVEHPNKVETNKKESINFAFMSNKIKCLQRKTIFKLETKNS